MPLPRLSSAELPLISLLPVQGRTACQDHAKLPLPQSFSLPPKFVMVSPSLKLSFLLLALSCCRSSPPAPRPAQHRLPYPTTEFLSTPLCGRLPAPSLTPWFSRRDSEDVLFLLCRTFFFFSCALSALVFLRAVPQFSPLNPRGFLPSSASQASPLESPPHMPVSTRPAKCVIISDLLGEQSLPRNPLSALIPPSCMKAPFSACVFFGADLSNAFFFPCLESFFLFFQGRHAASPLFFFLPASMFPSLPLPPSDQATPFPSPLFQLQPVRLPSPPA